MRSSRRSSARAARTDDGTGIDAAPPAPQGAGAARVAVAAGGPHLQLRLRGRPGHRAAASRTSSTVSGGFGVTDQLANVAPMAIAALASTPAIIAGGFDISISPLIVFTNSVLHRLAGPARARRRRLGPDHARPRARGRRAQRPAHHRPAGPGDRRHARDVLQPAGRRPVHRAEPGLARRAAAGSSISPARSGRSPARVFTIGLPLLIWFALRLRPVPAAALRGRQQRHDGVLQRRQRQRGAGRELRARRPLRRHSAASR